MVKLYRIPGTDVKIRISQDEVDFCIRVVFDHDGESIQCPDRAVDANLIRSLGFPTEPIDGGDLEEVTA